MAKVAVPHAATLDAHCNKENVKIKVQLAISYACRYQLTLERETSITQSLSKRKVRFQEL